MSQDVFSLSHGSVNCDCQVNSLQNLQGISVFLLIHDFSIGFTWIFPIFNLMLLKTVYVRSVWTWVSSVAPFSAMELCRIDLTFNEDRSQSDRKVLSKEQPSWRDRCHQCSIDALRPKPSYGIDAIVPASMPSSPFGIKRLFLCSNSIDPLICLCQPSPKPQLCSSFLPQIFTASSFNQNQLSSYFLL